ncbi:cation:proton antiporter [Marinibacterium sp. SX1]|uniref:cation:proton antiporter n=1 Tax=Marinibacterium sp. SX1 TaxID=3388424 RepID=UPI003D186ADF
METWFFISFIAALFFLIGLAEPLAAKLRLPYSAIIALIGILVGLGASFFLRTDLTDALNPVAEAILGLPIEADVFIYVFLPTLLFQATIGMDLRQMIGDGVPIIVLAVIAVVAATGLVGLALSWTSALPLTACLLIGSIVSTTDPSAVVSIFRSIAAPQRLTRIIEGESLLNDAAAIALFSLFLGFVMVGIPDPSMGEAMAEFPVLIFGGVLTGWLASQIAVRVMSLLGDFMLAQLSVSVALPYLAYITAEQLLGASGVIAVVVSGLTLHLTAPLRLSPQAWTKLREVWDLLAHWAGAMIFVLAALFIPRLLQEVRLSDFGLILVVVAAAVVARALIVFVLMPALTALRLSPAVELSYRAAILWGGLRGALTLALALAVTENPMIPHEIKRLVGILATGFTLFTLVVQGTTLRWVITRLGLDRLSPFDAALLQQAVAVALQTVREEVAEVTQNYRLNRDTVRSEAKQFGARLEDAVRDAEETTGILDKDRVKLGLISLAAAEREAALDQMRERLISARVAERLNTSADTLIEAVRLKGRAGYLHAARDMLAYGRAFRMALTLHNRLRLSAPLGRLTADRFEFMLAQRVILEELDAFIDNRIRRIHGKRVAQLLHEMMARRNEALEAALEGMRLQYPGYAEELERLFIRRAALRLEEREYRGLHEDGLIGAEVLTALLQELTDRRGSQESRPALDVAIQRADLITQLPFYDALDKRSRRRLQRGLKSVYVNAGDLVPAATSTGRSVHFIASGALEVKRAGRVNRLGRGDMFGHVVLLNAGARPAQARAIAPSVLLELKEAQFRKLLDRSEALREAVRISLDDQQVDMPRLPAALSLGRKSAARKAEEAAAKAGADKSAADKGDSPAKATTGQVDEARDGKKGDGTSGVTCKAADPGKVVDPGKAIAPDKSAEVPAPDKTTKVAKSAEAEKAAGLAKAADPDKPADPDKATGPKTSANTAKDGPDTSAPKRDADQIPVAPAGKNRITPADAVSDAPADTGADAPAETAPSDTPADDPATKP